MEPFKAPQKNKYGLLLGNCLGMLLLTFLLVGGAFYGLRLYTHHGEEIKMPNLHGKSFEVAKQTLKEMGLTAEVVDTVGDREWVYGIEVNGKNVITGQRISVDIPITLVVGNGSGTEEYNGNDSLDYFLNGLQEETDESVIDEGIE